MSGTLYVIATPIGNLEDLSPRAERLLGEVALIAAEDTRVTRKLLTHFGIRTPLTSYHAYSSSGKGEALLQRLEAGDDVALVSDAGTPGISDPGAELVQAAVAAGITVVPIPGPSAVITALCASGLDPSRFLFQGFLPRSRGDRKKVLAPLRPLPHTLVFYEAPNRVAETLASLREELGDRRVVVARELSKRFEELLRGTFREMEERLRTTPPRGECVVMVEGWTGPAETPSQQDAESVLRALLEGGSSVRDAAREAAERLGLPRKELYAQAMRLAGDR